MTMRSLVRDEDRIKSITEYKEADLSMIFGVLRFVTLRKISSSTMIIRFFDLFKDVTSFHSSHLTESRPHNRFLDWSYADRRSVPDPSRYEKHVADLNRSQFCTIVMYSGILQSTHCSRSASYHGSTDTEKSILGKYFLFQALDVALFHHHWPVVKDPNIVFRDFPNTSDSFVIGSSFNNRTYMSCFASA